MDIWLLAIILSALLIGWLIGRLSRSTSSSSSSDPFNNCSESYIKGLNFLLSNKSDKAIELFVDLIKVDSETIETHLALGNLFRSKGEVDQAIKIHQNLIARPNLDQNQRVMALSELAEDYLKAGLLDRAENLYKELVQINPRNISAQKKLLEIYSLEKSWHQAKDAATMLYELEQDDGQLILTHCYCEMAEQSLNNGNLREVKQYLDKAIQIDNHCIRALLLLVEFHLRDNNLAKATKLFNQLLVSSPQFIEIYLKPAREILLKRGSTAKYQDFLIKQYEKTPVSPVAIELLKSYRLNEQHDEILAFLSRALDKSVSLELYDFVFEYFRSRPQQVTDLWNDLSQNFKNIKNSHTSYVCTICGYESQKLHWNCPSCNSWSSAKPVY